MPRRLPSLNALRAFEAAGRLGRMTLAAEELCVTHGAVSRQVRQLEQALAARLLEGPKSGLVLLGRGARSLPSSRRLRPPRSSGAAGRGRGGGHARRVLPL